MSEDYIIKHKHHIDRLVQHEPDWTTGWDAVKNNVALSH